MKRESEKEWYFGNADKERRGPFSYEEVRKSLCLDSPFVILRVLAVTLYCGVMYQIKVRPKRRTVNSDAY